MQIYSKIKFKLFLNLIKFIDFKCVDEWLRVNASCPTCRCSIINNPGSNNPGAGSDDEEFNGNSSNRNSSSVEMNNSFRSSPMHRNVPSDSSSLYSARDSRYHLLNIV